MNKIGVMMSVDSADGPMSGHFGKAEWIMVADAENGAPEFVKNEALNGKCAVEIAIHRRCADVIVADIGDGALGQLQAAQIRAWAVPGPIAGVEALQMFKEGKLHPVPPANASMRHGAGHGCCCSNRAVSEAPACCRG